MQLGSAANDLGRATVRKGLKCEMLAIPASGLHSYISITILVKLSSVQWGNESRRAFAGSYYVVVLSQLLLSASLGAQAQSLPGQNGARAPCSDQYTVIAMQGD